LAPFASIGRLEAVVKRHREYDSRQAIDCPREVILHGGVREDGSRKPKVEVTMVGISPEMAGVAKGAKQRNSMMDAGGDAQQVIVGEEADDDVGALGKRIDRATIRSKMSGPPLFDETGQSPSAIGQAALEVAAADEEESRVNAGFDESPAVTLGHGSGAGPLVR
jgi:hypothetical protein